MVQAVTGARRVDAGLHGKSVAGDQRLADGRGEHGPLLVVELVGQGDLELACHH